jgi:TPR repeat protein
MIAFLHRIASTARPHGRLGMRGFALGCSAACLFLVGSRAPAAAFDASEPRNVAAVTAPLPMFKDPRAALRIGLESYHAGNTKKSLEALRYAADGGESLAQWKLGRMYADGDGVARDDAKAYGYFSKLVEHFAEDEPSPRERLMAAGAFVAVGVYYLEGIAAAQIAPDVTRAFDLFRYAATYLGNADAQYNLARMYLDGNGVAKDARQAANWLDLSARKGHAPSQALLGHLLFKGEAGGPPQRARGLMYLTLARETAGDRPSDQWIVDLHAAALARASEADRKAAVVMLEFYLAHRD